MKFKNVTYFMFAGLERTRSREGRDGFSSMLSIVNVGPGPIWLDIASIMAFGLTTAVICRSVRDVCGLRVAGAVLLGAGLLPRRPTPLRRAAARDRGGSVHRAAGGAAAGKDGGRTKLNCILATLIVHHGWVRLYGLTLL